LWNTFDLFAEQEQVALLLQHVVLEHGIENKTKIRDCFFVNFVEQLSYQYLIDICEDKLLNKME